MKGFILPQKTALLAFDEGSEYEGARVRCNLRVPLGLVLEFQQMGGASEDATDAERVRVAAERIAVLRKFGECVLLEWNLMDAQGHNLPATGEGMMAVDMDFAIALITAWVEAVQNPPAPLGEPSASGSTLEATSLPSSLTPN